MATNPSQAQQLSKLIEDIKQYFVDNLDYKFCHPLGSGSFGQTLLFETSLGEKHVVKFQLPWAINTLQVESDWLRKLRGAEHIVRLFATDADDSSCPVIILEYLKNGTFKNLIHRLQETGLYLPNRVLWRIFLCLIRASVGTAYPPWRDGEREYLPPGPGKTHSRLIHNDIHEGNLAFGDFTPGENEHNLVPVLKLLDFGAAGALNPGDDELVDQLAVRNAAEMMACLVLRETADTIPNDLQEMTVPIPNSNGVMQDVEVAADGRLLDDPRLQPELKWLLLSCSADDPNDRPTLQTVLNKCETAVATYVPGIFSAIPGYDFESETASRIQQLIQQLFFDAPRDVPTTSSPAQP
ncbi:kinase-like domain-containing protein [Xylariaceae sp. FL0255]|nr:kinase-like domain-containing protein [Xylariaceae sp. FL0255]